MPRNQYSTDARREYQRNYRGFKRGDRCNNFKSEFPNWEELRSQLPPEWAKIVDLHYLQGQTDRQIGERTRVSRQAIAKRREKAIQKLIELKGLTNVNESGILKT